MKKSILQVLIIFSFIPYISFASTIQSPPQFSSLKDKALYFINKFSSKNPRTHLEEHDLIVKNTRQGIKRSKEELTLYDDNALALVPGRVYFYHGAMGIHSAKHYGLYLGEGWIIEKYRIEGKGAIRINRIEQFRTSVQTIRHLKNLFHKEENNHRKVYPSELDSWPRKKIIRLLLLLFNEKTERRLSRYGLLTSNCYHLMDFSSSKLLIKGDSRASL